jgi:thiol-disulfide isomerase/thioredoxin
VTLATFKGKVVLVNFWATWCAPCVREMPALDALQAKFGTDRFVIVAVSLDRLGFEKITPFLKRIGVERLTVLLDRKRALYRKVGGQGLPTTLLLDHEGKVRGYLEGPAEWDGKDAEALIHYYLKAANPVKKVEAGPPAR